MEKLYIDTRTDSPSHNSPYAIMKAISVDSINKVRVPLFTTKRKLKRSTSCVSIRKKSKITRWNSLPSKLKYNNTNNLLKSKENALSKEKLREKKVNNHKQKPRREFPAKKSPHNRTISDFSKYFNNSDIQARKQNFAKHKSDYKLDKRVDKVIQKQESPTSGSLVQSPTLGVHRQKSAVSPMPKLSLSSHNVPNLGKNIRSSDASWVLCSPKHVRTARPSELTLFTRLEVTVDDLSRALRSYVENKEINNLQLNNDFRKLLSNFKSNLINQFNNKGTTVLYEACDLGLVIIVKILLQIDGIKISGPQQQNTQNTTLHIATSRGYWEIVKILLSKGAKPERNIHLREPVDELFQPTCTVDTKTKEFLHEFWIMYNKGNEQWKSIELRKSKFRRTEKVIPKKYEPLVTKDAYYNEDGLIESATLKTLIDCFISNVELKTKLELRHIFLTYKIFDHSTQDIMEVLMEKYTKAISHAFRSRIVAIVVRWIVDFWIDIKSYPETLELLAKFTAQLPEPEKNWINKTKEEAERTSVPSKPTIFVQTTSMNNMDPHFWVNSPYTIAQHIHAIDLDVCRKVPPTECWSDSAAKILSSHWNHMNYWASTSILAADDLHSLLKRMEILLFIIDELLKLNNYMSSHAIFIVIDKLLLGKAKALISGISKEAIDKYEEFRELMGNLNYLPIQNKLKEVISSSLQNYAVPLPMLFSKYKVSLAEAKGLEKGKNGTKLIKVSLMQNLAVSIDCIFRLHRLEKTKFDLEQDIINSILSVKVLSEEEIKTRSSKLNDSYYLKQQFIQATKDGHSQLILLLSKMESLVLDFNSKDISGFAALHYAAMYDHKQVVQILLNDPRVNVNIITENTGETSLHVASRCESADALSLLLTFGCETQLRDMRGQTAENIADGMCHQVWKIFNSSPIDKRRKALLNGGYPVFKKKSYKISQTEIFSDAKINHNSAIAQHFSTSEGVNVETYWKYHPERRAKDYIILGDCYRIYGKYEEALKSYQEAILKAQIKHEYLAWFGIAKIHLQKKNITNCKQALLRVQQLLNTSIKSDLRIAVETNKLLNDLGESEMLI